MSDHHPPHIYLDDTWYTITSSTLRHAPYLAREQAKNLVRDTLQSLVRQFEIVLAAWVILDDHYHLLLKTGRGSDLPRFFGRLHGTTSRQINVWDDAIGRQIWHNYWDTCVRTEAGYWTRLNYIHNNPVKHGYVQRWDDWAWSSLHHYLRTKGEEWVLDCWDRYPAIDYLREDEFGLHCSGESLHSRDRLGADFCS